LAACRFKSSFEFLQLSFELSFFVSTRFLCVFYLKHMTICALRLVKRGALSIKKLAQAFQVGQHFGRLIRWNGCGDTAKIRGKRFNCRLPEGATGVSDVNKL
jgi:hypothetical protein